MMRIKYIYRFLFLILFGVLQSHHAQAQTTNYVLNAIDVDVFVSNPCDGNDNGFIRFDVNGGSGGTVSVQIFGPKNLFVPQAIAVSGSFTFDASGTGLPSGTYDLILFDDTDVINTSVNPAYDPVDLLDLGVITISQDIVTNNSSCVTPDGEIEISITNGSQLLGAGLGSYQYTWSSDNGLAGLPIGPTTWDGETALNLNALLGVDLPGGTYTIDITDDYSSCLATADIAITDPSPSDQTISTGSPLDVCNGDDASIDVDGSEVGVDYTIHINGAADNASTQTGAGAPLTLTTLSGNFADTDVLTVVAVNGFCTPRTLSTSITINLLDVPSTPVATAATNEDCTDFDANWNASTGVVSYELDVATDVGFTAFVAGFNSLNVGNVTTFNVSGLSNGTDYFYRIRAINGCGATVDSNIIMATTLDIPATPVAIAATNIDCDNFDANWNAAIDAVSYELDVATDVGFTAFVAGFNSNNVGNVTTFNIPGLTSGTDYFYRVRAVNTCGTTVSSNTISTTTLDIPATPVAIAATNIDCDNFDANWNAAAGAVSYAIDVATDVGFTAFVAGFNDLNVGNVTTVNVTGLVLNTDYFYRVRAVNTCGTTVSSNTITLTTLDIPSTPVAIAATNEDCDNFDANWNVAAGATSYAIDVATDAGFTAFVAGFNNLNVGNVTTANITGLAINTDYFYRVRAVNACGTTVSSNTITTTTLDIPATPVELAATNEDCDNFDANWNAATGATSYALDVATDVGFTAFVAGFNDLNVGNVTTFNVTGLSLNTDYFYRVRAVNACGTTVSSGTIITTTLDIPATPVELAASNEDCDNFDANWNAAAGATSYALDVATDVGFTAFVAGFNDLNVGNVTTFNVSGLVLGTDYFYRVRGVNSCGATVSSGTIMTTTLDVEAAPVAIAATNEDCTDFDANWNAVVGATSYEIDVATDVGFTAFVAGFNALDVGNVTTFNVSGLSNGTDYFYRVRTVNGCGAGTDSNTITTTTLDIPSTPVAIAATNVDCDNFDANWNAATDAVSYELDVATDIGFTAFVAGFNSTNVGNVTTFNIPGLTNGTDYFYRVRAVNSCGTTLDSNIITTTTLDIPATPVELAASNEDCDNFDANWNAAAGAVSYALDVATDVGFTAFVAGFNDLNVGNVTTFNVTGLAVNTDYFYRVRAVNTCGTTVSSGTITTTTLDIPTAPVELAASNEDCDNFDANWNAAAGAASYALDVATDAGFTAFVAGFNDLNVGNVTTFNVTGLSLNTDYFYRVRAVNSCGTTVSSGTITTTTLDIPATPVELAASNEDCDNFDANWNAATGATSYALDVATDAGFTAFVAGFNDLNVGNVTTFNVTGLSLGTDYFYRVRGVNSCGATVSSGTITTTTLDIPTTPVELAASNEDCDNFDANWNAATGATSYALDVATDAGFTAFVAGFNDLNVGNVTTFNVTGLTLGTDYFYRVRALNSCGTTISSGTTTTTTLDVETAPVAIAATNEDCTDFDANWNATAGATSYEIDVSADAGFAAFVAGYNALNVGNVTTINVNGLISGTDYFYRVRAINSCGISANSNTITTTTLDILSAPVAIAASNEDCDNFDANWNAVAGVTSYEIDVATDVGFTGFVAGFNALDVGNVTTFNVSGLANGTDYFYRVRAVNSCGTSVDSNTITTTTLDVLAAPVEDVASNEDCDNFDANWNVVAGATSYEIDVAADAGFAAFVAGYNALDVGNVTTVNVTGLIASTNYFYRVRAINACGASINSGTTTTTTLGAPTIPVAIAAANEDCDNFDANWNAATDATSYEIDVATDAGFTAIVAGFNALNVGNVTTFNITGLAASTNYFYRVRAVNNCSTSAESNVITTTTLAAATAPTAIAASNLDCDNFDANWNATVGAISYEIDVAEDAGFTIFVAGFNAFNVGNVTTVNVTGLNSNTDYFYRVRVIKTCGTSTESNTITATTTGVPPANVAIAATNEDCDNFDANWNAEPSALTYLLDVAFDAAFTSFVPGFNALDVGNVTTFNVSGLTTGTDYFYRVSYTKACGTSTASNVISTTTLSIASAPVADPVADVCVNGTIPTLTATGTNLIWYDLDPGLGGATQLGTGASFTPSALELDVTVAGTTSFFLTQDTGCGESAATQVDVNVVNTPSAPSVAGTTTYCVNEATITDLSVAGGADISWYSDAGLTNEIGTATTFNPTLIPGWDVTVAGSFDVFVTETLACGESASTQVTITIVNSPTAPAVAGTTTYCVNEVTITDLSVSGGIDISWYSDAGLTNEIGTATTFNPTSIPGWDVTVAGTFDVFVTETLACGESTATQITIDIVATPNAPSVAGTTTYCVNEVTITDLSVAGGADISWYSDAGLTNEIGTATTFNPTLIPGWDVTVAGSFDVFVTETLACGESASTQVTITIVNSPTAPAVAGTTTYCVNEVTIADLSVSGGIDISWYSDAGLTTEIGTGNTFNPTSIPGWDVTVAGSFDVFVTETLACGESTATQVTITVSDVPAATVANAATNIQCTSFDASWSAVAGATDYRVEVASDVNFINIFLNQTVATTTLTVSAGIAQGTNYFYRVYAISACGESIASNEINLTTSNTGCAGSGVDCFAFTTNIVSITRPDCSDDNGEFELQITSNSNAGIQVVFDASSGLGSYSVASPGNTITINTDDGDPLTPGLSAGTYNYQISDGLGNVCPSTDSFVELKTLTSIEANLDSKSDITCSGELGSATFNNFSIPGSYFYSIDGSAPTIPLPGDNTVPDLPTGTTTIRIGNLSDPCPYQQDVTILDFSTPIVVNATVTNASCNTADGRIEINGSDVTGGSGTYSGFTFGVSGDPNPTDITLPLDIQTLAPGTYTFTVTDDVGCSLAMDMEIDGPDQANPSITPTDASCSNPDGTSGSIGIVIGDSGDIDRILAGVTYTLELSLSGEVIESKDLNNEFSYTFNSIGAGTYTLTTSTSDNTCPKVEQIMVGGVTPVRFEYELSCLTNEDRGLRLFNVQGEPGNGVFTLRLINRTTNLTEDIAISLIPGTDEITITDEPFLTSGNEYTLRLVQAQAVCSPGQELFYDAPGFLLIPQTLSALEITSSSSLPDQFTGAFTIGGFTGGYQPDDNAFPYLIRIELDSAAIPSQTYTTEYDTVRLNSSTLQFEMAYTEVPAGRYLVEVVDQLGCGISFYVRVGLNTDLFIPNIFTPNGDEVNESFFIRNLPSSGTEIVITNRWGKEVFKASDYANDWDGGAEADGIYYYKLAIDGGSSYTGWVEIVRSRRIE